MFSRAFAFITVAALILVTCKSEEMTESEPRSGTAASTTANRTEPVEVQLKIFGLCSLVDPSDADETVRTLVVGNARGMNHRPMIMIDPANKAAAPPTGFVRQCNSDQSECYDYFELTGKEIVLDESPGWDVKLNPQLNPSEAGDENNARCPTTTGSGKNTDSLHWLPRLSHVLREPNLRARRGFLHRGARAKDVSARMRMPGGSDLSSVFESQTTFLWRFQDTASNSRHAQAIADYLRYTFTVKVDRASREISIYARDIDKPTSTPAELLKLHAPDPVLKLSLANIPPDSPFQDPATIRIGHTDFHFVHHYRMLEGSHPQFVPKATRVCSTSAGIIDTVYCGPDRVR